MGEEELRRWEARPLLGAALHAALVVAPLILGIGVGVVVRDALPERWAFGIPPWAVAGVVGMVVVWAVQPITRRLIPLSWLLKLGMLFPGRAPTRFKIARQAGRLQDLERRITTSATDTDEQAAQRSAELILSLVTALTAHDRRTRGHAERTRVFTDLLSEELGLPRGDRDRLRWAALLHDIGKLEVSHRLLNKPGRPTTREWEQLRRHPEAGDQLIAPLRSWLGEWADTVLHHHERWDGAGYPAGLAGDQIALGARIVAVADVYDVMTAVRSYKRPSSAAAARQELVSCAGTQFDPAVVRAFLSIPLPRLRWALGPFAWVAQLPGVRDTAHVGIGAQVGAQQATAAAPTAVGAAVAATGLMIGSKMTPPPPPVVIDDGTERGPTTVRVEALSDPEGTQLGGERAREALRAAIARASGTSDEPSDAETDDAGGPADDPVASAAPRAPGGPAAGAGGGATSGGSGTGTGAGSGSARDSSGRSGTSGGERGTRSTPPVKDDRTPDRQPTPTASGDPSSREDCFEAGWEVYGFRNQGQCVRYVETGWDDRVEDPPSGRVATASHDDGEPAPQDDRGTAPEDDRDAASQAHGEPAPQDDRARP